MGGEILVSERARQSSCRIHANLGSALRSVRMDRTAGDRALSSTTAGSAHGAHGNAAGSASRWKKLKPASARSHSARSGRAGRAFAVTFVDWVMPEWRRRSHQSIDSAYGADNRRSSCSPVLHEDLAIDRAPWRQHFLSSRCCRSLSANSFGCTASSPAKADRRMTGACARNMRSAWWRITRSISS